MKNVVVLGVTQKTTALHLCAQMVGFKPNAIEIGHQFAQFQTAMRVEIVHDPVDALELSKVTRHTENMGPKIEAAKRFIEGGGKRAVITSINAIEAAVEGKAGTELIK